MASEVDKPAVTSIALALLNYEPWNTTCTISQQMAVYVE